MMGVSVVTRDRRRYWTFLGYTFYMSAITMVVMMMMMMRYR